MAVGLLTLFSLITVCYGAFTKIPPNSTTLFPGSTLRLNCASTSATPVAWFVTDSSNNRRDVFIFNAITSPYSALFNIDRSGGGYHLVGQTTVDSSYCGLYECVEENGASSNVAEATVSVSTSPDCDVVPRYPSPSERVTYTCNATSVCVGGSASLVIQRYGTEQEKGNDVVRWDTWASNVANATITCSSVTVCPPVNVTGIPEAMTQTVSLMCIIIICILGGLLLVCIIVIIILCVVLSRRNKNEDGKPKPQTDPGVSVQKIDLHRSRKMPNKCHNFGYMNLVFPVLSSYQQQSTYLYYPQQPSGNSCPPRRPHYYPREYIVSPK